MTYGDLIIPNIVAHCRHCGKYKTEDQIHMGKRGDPRCNQCGMQLKTKPSLSRKNLNAKRRQETKRSKKV